MKKVHTLAIVLVFLTMGLQAQELLLPDTLRVCSADSVQVDAGEGFDTYVWNTGESTRMIWLKTTGEYSVQALAGDTVDVNGSVFFVNVPAMIFQEDTLIDCSDTIQLSVDTTAFKYLWTPGDFTENSIDVWPRENTAYALKISDSSNALYYCIDSVKIEVEPKIFVDTLIQLSMGCPGEKVAQVKIEATGDFEPLEYEWSEGFQDLYEPNKAGGLYDGDFDVIITDTLGCSHTEEFTVEAYPLPEIELYTDKEDDQGSNVVYLQNPAVNFSFENVTYDSLGVDTFQLITWSWDFGDETTSNLTSPIHSYTGVGTYTVTFDHTTFFNCEASDSITVEVKPVKLKVPNVITPNGDGINDTFVIDIDEGDGGDGGNGGETFKNGSSDIPDLSEFYLENTLVIFNRWGNELFKITNYENDWDAEDLVEGVYFYVLKCHGQYRDDVYKGSLTILRYQY